MKGSNCSNLDHISLNYTPNAYLEVTAPSDEMLIDSIKREIKGHAIGILASPVGLVREVEILGRTFSLVRTEVQNAVSVDIKKCRVAEHY